MSREREEREYERERERFGCWVWQVDGAAAVGVEVGARWPAVEGVCLGCSCRGLERKARELADAREGEGRKEVVGLRWWLLGVGAGEEGEGSGTVSGARGRRLGLLAEEERKRRGVREVRSRVRSEERVCARAGDGSGAVEGRGRGCSGKKKRKRGVRRRAARLAGGWSRLWVEVRSWGVGVGFGCSRREWVAARLRCGGQRGRWSALVFDGRRERGYEREVVFRGGSVEGGEEGTGRRMHGRRLAAKRGREEEEASGGGRRARVLRRGWRGGRKREIVCAVVMLEVAWPESGLACMPGERVQARSRWPESVDERGERTGGGASEAAEKKKKKEEEEEGDGAAAGVGQRKKKGLQRVSREEEEGERGRNGKKKRKRRWRVRFGWPGSLRRWPRRQGK